VTSVSSRLTIQMRKYSLPEPVKRIGRRSLSVLSKLDGVTVGGTVVVSSVEITPFRPALSMLALWAGWSPSGAANPPWGPWGVVMSCCAVRGGWPAFSLAENFNTAFQTATLR
jgi:hypothetical protein